MDKTYQGGIREGQIIKAGSQTVQNLSKEANYPFYEGLTEFSARQAQLSQGGIGKKIDLIHNLSLWNISGIILGSFLAYFLLDSLFVEPKKNGEDALVLSLSPGVERNHLFFGKTLALITSLAIFAFLGFVFPYTIFLYVFGPGITA
ncbi:1314_t:CDS:2 [Funneliformis geosporum]|uniref:1314_t:CDS:1 n=1 Tax=Funneliformis geosporum TaxID=1117311 RepID=A0A9W4SA32_9GLOM|nr:1314_t:CDS:2 [Funneliformis geosporum]